MNLMIQQISNSDIHDSDKAAVLKCISEVSAAGAKRIKGQDAYDRAAVLFNMCTWRKWPLENLMN